MEFPSRYPLHVTLSVTHGAPPLRDVQLVALLRGQIAQSHRGDYRINEFAIEDTHLHMIAEAEGKIALARGIQQMNSRIARRMHRALGTRGRFFEDRYHHRVLRTPREVRHALCYVLNNTRHHAFDRGELLPPDWIDPYSSAPWFRGWASSITGDEDWKQRLQALPPPVLPARTWLLNIGWRQHGLLRFDEIPGRRKKRRT